MKIVHITWLVIAILYWINSHRVDSHNSWKWHAQCCSSIDSHNQETSKKLEWYYANTPNDIGKKNSWYCHAKCCLISIDVHNQITSKQLEWYYANRPNDFVNNNSWKWHVYCF